MSTAAKRNSKLQAGRSQGERVIQSLSTQSWNHEVTVTGLRCDDLIKLPVKISKGREMEVKKAETKWRREDETEADNCAVQKTMPRDSG